MNSVLKATDSSKKVLRKVKSKVKSILTTGLGRGSRPAFSPEQTFIPKYQIVSRPGTYTETIFGWRGEADQLHHWDITSSSPVEFELKPLDEGIIGVHLYLGTHGRVNTCTVKVELFGLKGGERVLLASCERKADTLVNNEYNFFHFLKTVTDGGPHLLLRISSPDSAIKNYVAVWGCIREREKTSGIDFTDYSPIVTIYGEAPRKESFIPRYTASGFSLDVAESVFGWQAPSLHARQVPLFPGSSVEFTFRCPVDGLAQICILFVTFGRTNNCHCIMTLSKLSGNQWDHVADETIAGNSLENFQTFDFLFSKIKSSKNSWFKFTIESPDGSPGNCIGVQGTVCKHDLALFKNLTWRNDIVSMVDTMWPHANLKPLYKKVLPIWKNLAQPVEKAEAKIAIIADEDDTAVFFADYDTTQLSDVMFVRPSNISQVIDRLSTFHFIFIPDQPLSPGIETLLELCRRTCIPTCSIGFTPKKMEEAAHPSREASGASGPEYFVEDRKVPRKYVGPRCDLHLTNELSKTPTRDELYAIYEKLFPRYKAQRMPSISIISILYHKQAEICTVLESLAAQDYPGAVEILLVDDCSPDASVERVERLIAARPRDFGPNGKMPITIIRNDQNIGNCGSRNKALAVAKHDIALIIDADCVLNRRSLSAHAAAHSIGDVDVVIGTHNLETDGKDPISVAQDYDAAPLLARSKAQLQDKTVPPSFLNAITRNISVRRSFIQGSLFDDLFAYSKNPDSGFGWEDVEAGYRLFKQGARFRYTDLSISVHISHPSTTDESSKPPRSMKNFRRLLEKHPDLKHVARRWVLDTYMKICAWMDNAKGAEFTKNDDNRNWIEHHLKGLDSYRPVYQPRKQYRVLTYRWHCPHQYEIYKLPHKFTLTKFENGVFTNHWEYDQRPHPLNTKWKPYAELDERDYDFAILHFDENSLFPENSNGVLGSDWGRGFRFLRENFNLPKVAVCHGTPQFQGQYNPYYWGPELGKPLEYERQRMVDYLGDIPVVCNSYQARAEWGFKNSRVIWQGFDPMEFGPSPTGHGIVTLGKMMKERPVYRGYNLFIDVKNLLPADIKFHWISVDRPAYDYRSISNDYAYAKFRLYNQAIRKNSIYFNPTLRSPMPRSRGEAMMSGLVTVSADNHDVSMFIKNGVNGFYSNDPAELAEYLLFLVKNPDAARRMGERSRALSVDVFNIDRFHREWNHLIDSLVK